MPVLQSPHAVRFQFDPLRIPSASVLWVPDPVSTLDRLARALETEVSSILPEVRSSPECLVYLTGLLEKKAEEVYNPFKQGPNQWDKPIAPTSREVDAFYAAVCLSLSQPETIQRALALGEKRATPTVPLAGPRLAQALLLWGLVCEARFAASFAATHGVKLASVNFGQKGPYISEINWGSLLRQLFPPVLDKSALELWKDGGFPKEGRAKRRKELAAALQDEFLFDPSPLIGVLENMKPGPAIHTKTSLAKLIVDGSERSQKANIEQGFPNREGLPETPEDAARLCSHLGDRWTTAQREYMCAYTKDGYLRRAKHIPSFIPLPSTVDSNKFLILPKTTAYMLSRHMVFTLTKQEQAAESKASLVSAAVGRTYETLWARQLQLCFKGVVFRNDTYAVLDERWAAGLRAKKDFLGLPVPTKHGDIDLFVVDRQKKRIAVVECKHCDPLERQSDFGKEFRLFGPDGTYTGKMRDRYDWVCSVLPNLKFPGTGDSCKGWEVDWAIITDHQRVSLWCTRKNVDRVFVAGSKDALRFLRPDLG